MPLTLAEATVARRKKDSLRKAEVRLDPNTGEPWTWEGVHSKWINEWSQGKPLEESSLIQLEGERLADIIKMVEPEASAAYTELFVERSRDKDIFGREGKGWGFPILNKVRGKVHAHRFEKALRKEDIKVWATGASSREAHTWELDEPMRTTGLYAKKGWTRSKSDADLFMAVGRPLDDVLDTLIHEGGHMEPLIGKQLLHGKAIRSIEELGGQENVEKLKSEGKAVYEGREGGKKMYSRHYTGQGSFERAIKHRAETATSKIENKGLMNKLKFIKRKAQNKLRESDPGWRGS